MKIYDGPALIADKGDAPVLPVRIDGVEFTPFSRLARHGGRLRRHWFPKVTITLYAPRRLRDPGRTARPGAPAPGRAGALRRDVGHDGAPPRPAEPVRRRARFPRGAWRQASDHGRPDRRPAHLQPCHRDQPGARPASGAPHRTRRGGRDHAAEFDRRRRRVSRFAGDRPRPGDAEPYGRRGRRAVGLPHRRAASRRSPRAALSNWPSSTPWRRRWPETVEIVWLEDLRATLGLADKLYGLVAPHIAASRHRRFGIAASEPAAILFTSGSEGAPKGVVLSHANLLANRRQLAARIDFSPADHLLNPLADVPQLRADRRVSAAAPVRRQGVSVPVAAALSDHPRAGLRSSPRQFCSAPTRSSPAMRAPPTLMIFTRCAMSSPGPSRCARRPAASGPSGSASASSKAMASPNARRSSPSTRRCISRRARSAACCR